ncbi:chromate resistance protein ChrB domain-containing protein [Undibacterium arcticum]|uniref:Chromate resistance protein ChrB domain-containing protein n=1 Tax=Undibacterium arcticum TaxID=1762892 RepID=A0ABV7F7J9_9BURK
MDIEKHGWLLLVASLPTSGATPRMRLWRAIKSLGCAALRDGAYLLPAAPNHEAAMAELAEQTNREGGQAWVVDVAPRSREDQAAFMALFDRMGEYAELAGQLSQARKILASQTPVEVIKLVKKLRKELDNIRRIDFFSSESSLSAEAAWSDFAEAANALLSPDEPHAAERPIALRNPADYQGRTWATRRNLWVDRVASAWLIRRFIDRKASFLWLDSPAACPPDALGFDFDDAAFTHVGDRVTFEVLLASFGLEADPGLARLGALVHALDVGGSSTPEAVGFEAIVSGARTRLNNDDALLAEIGTVLDSLLAHFNLESTT